MYTALWPASRGQSGLVLLPFGPWQAEHTADLVAPSAALPWVNGKASSRKPRARPRCGRWRGRRCGCRRGGQPCGGELKRCNTQAGRRQAARRTNRVFRSAALLLFPTSFRDARAPNCTLRPCTRFLSPENRMSRFSQARFPDQRRGARSSSRPMSAPRSRSPDAPTPASRAPSTPSPIVTALARTSKTPGRTRLLNFFELAPGQRLVDLPGYGYASAPAAERRTWPPLIEALRDARLACTGCS